MRAESVLLTKGHDFCLLGNGPREPQICAAHSCYPGIHHCISLFLSAFFFSNPLKKEGRGTKHGGISWQNASHRLLTQLGLEKQPWDVLIPGLCSRGHKLQAEIMKLQGVTPCNVSLCSAMTAEGSMPGCDDSKGWNRSPREALELPAQGEEGTNTCQSGFGMLISPLVWGGYYIIFWGSFQPNFLKLNLKPCNMTLRTNEILPQSQWLLNYSFKTAPISQLPSTTASSWCAFPAIFSLKNICCIFHAVFIFVWETSVKLKFPWSWNFSEIESIKRFLKHLISQVVGIEKLPYTKGLPSLGSLLMPKPDAWGK